MIKTREGFAQLINQREYRVAVEVGVKVGGFSEFLLRSCPSLTLYSVDRWDLDGEKNRAKHYPVACSRLSVFGDRSIVIRGRSVEVALQVLDQHPGGVCFVYIDADHSKRGVTKDISAWWRVVRPGGMLAGHDYVRIEKFGVVEAVDEWAAAHPECVVRLTGCKGVPSLEQRHHEAATRRKPLSVIPSWYVTKPLD